MFDDDVTEDKIVTLLLSFFLILPLSIGMLNQIKHCPYNYKRECKRGGGLMEGGV